MKKITRIYLINDENLPDFIVSKMGFDDDRRQKLGTEVKLICKFTKMFLEVNYSYHRIYRIGIHYERIAEDRQKAIYKIPWFNVKAVKYED